MRFLLEFDDREQALDDLVNLTIAGIRQVEYFPRLLEALPNEDRAEGTPLHERLAAARRQSELAGGELAQDFPLLHAQATSTLWGALEAVLRNLFACLLRRLNRARPIEAFKKVRVLVAEFESLQGLERQLYLLDGLEEALATKRGSGIERFEILFRAFGMSSAIDSDVGTCLLELYHFRNVLVNRLGRVDGRLLAECPWRDLEKGSEVRISHAQYSQYKVALSLYLFAIVNRVSTYFGAGPSEHADLCHFV
jgi:hypothetical protein